jgi:hypothetical protein
MGTEVIVAALPFCDTHPLDAEPVLAAYDGKTKLGPWGYMCEECFPKFGCGLGTGRGQKLILKEDA